MKEPKRLLSQGATDFERRLLRAVANERPSATLRTRMQRGLGLVGPLAWASDAKAMLSTLAGKASSGVAIAAVAGAVGMAGAGFLLAWTSAPETSVREAVQPQRPEQPSAPIPERTRPERVAQVEAVEPNVVSSAAALPEADSQLREEIALLDRARAALQAGDARRCLERLDTYAERYPSGILIREAELLRRRARLERAGSTLGKHDGRSRRR